MNETCLDLLRITEESQDLIYENIELFDKLAGNWDGDYW